MPVVEERFPPPANSVYLKMRDWYCGEMHKACVQRARVSSGENDLFIAEHVVNKDEHWMVETGKLGQGGFGCVWAMEVPTLGVTLAMKTFSAVRLQFRLF